MKKIITLLVFITFIGCKSSHKTVSKVEAPIVAKTLDTLRVLEHDYDSFKNLEDEKYAGMSLNKAYKELLYNKKGTDVIVAVIDTEIDINHEEIKGYIWTNSDEIPSNGIDDDKNGYIDDIHGWNYLGSTDGKKNITYSNSEYIRIFRAYDSIYKNKTLQEVGSDSIQYKIKIKIR